MSAWSLSFQVALLLGSGFAVPGAVSCRGYVLRTVVPVERIFSTALTGMENAALAEHVILGGPLEAVVSELPSRASDHSGCAALTCE
jgi:hypothetical protein